MKPYLIAAGIVVALIATAVGVWADANDELVCISRCSTDEPSYQSTRASTLMGAIFLGLLGGAIVLAGILTRRDD